MTVSRVGKITKNGNYITTMKTEGTIVEVMGVKKQSGGLTYFIALPSAPPVGKTDDIDLDLFTVTERPYVVKNTETGADETLMLKWLSIK